jgi:hypothetical protein
MSVYFALKSFVHLRTAAHARVCHRMQACADAGDFTSFTALLRGLSPNAIDQELRSMQVHTACSHMCHETAHV